VIGLPKAIALTGGEVSDFEAYMPVMNPDVSAPKRRRPTSHDADFVRQDTEKRGGAAVISAEGVAVRDARRRVTAPPIYWR